MTDSCDAGPIPYRHLSRLQSSFHLASLDCLHLLGIDDVPRGIVFQSIARACTIDWVADGRVASPPAVTSGTTVQSVAASLRLPFETTRRHALALIDGGLCVREGSVLALAPASPSSGAIRTYLEGIHDAFLLLAARTIDFGIPMPRPRDGAVHPLASVLRHAMDLNLEPVDNFRSSGWDLNTMALWMAVSSIEVEHVTSDPVLSRRYAVAYTPDEVRRPVPLRTAAQRIFVPYASAWRRAVELERLGLMRRVRGGWLIARAQLEDERIRDAMATHAEHMLKRIRASVIDGLDPRRLRDDLLLASSSDRHDRPEW